MAQDTKMVQNTKMAQYTKMAARRNRSVPDMSRHEHAQIFTTHRDRLKRQLGFNERGRVLEHKADLQTEDDKEVEPPLVEETLNAGDGLGECENPKSEVAEMNDMMWITDRTMRINGGEVQETLVLSHMHMHNSLKEIQDQLSALLVNGPSSPTRLDLNAIKWKPKPQSPSKLTPDVRSQSPCRPAPLKYFFDPVSKRPPSRSPQQRSPSKPSEQKSPTKIATTKSLSKPLAIKYMFKPPSQKSPSKTSSHKGSSKAASQKSPSKTSSNKSSSKAQKSSSQKSRSKSHKL